MTAGWVAKEGCQNLPPCSTYALRCLRSIRSARALNGNNSYGTWGSVSQGFDTGETAITGTIVGQQLGFTYTGGLINAGDTVTAASGGTAIVTNVQYSANKVYVKNATGTFSMNSALTLPRSKKSFCHAH